jgi:hypothetical protein
MNTLQRAIWSKQNLNVLTELERVVANQRFNGKSYEEIVNEHNRSADSIKLMERDVISRL